MELFQKQRIKRSAWPYFSEEQIVFCFKNTSDYELLHVSYLLTDKCYVTSSLGF